MQWKMNPEWFMAVWRHCRFFVQVHRSFVDGAMWGNWLRCYKAIETGAMAF